MRSRLIVMASLLAILGVACAKSSSTGTGAGNDLLAKITGDGVLRVSTDPAYPPQSSLDEKTGKWQGFDIDVATEIAKRLGVKVAWKTPNWDTITSGHWNGRWDISVGSMTVTPERAQVLDFSPAYYYTPAGVAVNKDNTTLTDPGQLSGKKVGVCGDCTYQKYLEHTLNIPGYTIDFKIDSPDIHTYDTDTTAIEDLALGDGVRLDAVMSAVPHARAGHQGRQVHQAPRPAPVLRAARRGRGQELDARPGQPGEQDQADRRGDAPGRDPVPPVDEVVRHGSDGRFGVA